MTGNFGVEGGMNLHTAFVPLFGGGGAAEADGRRRSRWAVTGSSRG